MESGLTQLEVHVPHVGTYKQPMSLSVTRYNATRWCINQSNEKYFQSWHRTGNIDKTTVECRPPADLHFAIGNVIHLISFAATEFVYTTAYHVSLTGSLMMGVFSITSVVFVAQVISSFMNKLQLLILLNCVYAIKCPMEEIRVGWKLSYGQIC